MLKLLIHKCLASVTIEDRSYNILRILGTQFFFLLDASLDAQ